MYVYTHTLHDKCVNVNINNAHILHYGSQSRIILMDGIARVIGAIYNGTLANGQN